MSRTYAIADLHGRYDLLCAALDAIKRHGDGKIVTLGDYVDRGAESAAIVHLLRLMQQNDPIRVVCAGNHEDMMVRAGEDRESFWHWVENGGRETLASCGVNHVDDVPAEDRAWLAALPSQATAGDRTPHRLPRRDLGHALWPSTRPPPRSAPAPMRAVSVSRPQRRSWRRFLRLSGRGPYPSPETPSGRP